MEIVSSPLKKSNTILIQWFITAVLALILAALVGGYIYYGMKIAQTDSVTTPVTAEPASIESLPSEMTLAEKLKILQSLASTVTSTVTVTEKAEILSSLSSTDESDMSEAEKRAILLQLSTPNASELTQ